MDDLVPFLEHHAAFLRAMGAGLLGILIPLICGTPSVLRRLGGILAFSGGWRPFSPNMLTLVSLVGTLAAFGLYLAGFVTVGIGLACWCGIFDRLDGRMAHVLDRARGEQMAPRGLWEKMNHPGGTDLGKALDPFCDKVKCFAIMAAFASFGLMSPWLVGLLAIPEILGTIARWPFDRWWPFSLLARHQKDTGATSFGKLKALLQWVAVIACVPFHQDWMSDAWSLKERSQFLNGLLILCIAFAVASVISRLRVFHDSPSAEALKRLDRGFGHD
ncbi:hypothetical protein A2856_02990 [Candidatus Uhrbacteria bacterium RIFCSPHIGHO2_01_FULL_63_20]|uniref:CDP-alcohol phosphatidyltransferase n=1 Tax=Candidatus Uhrbacteria bacterium RIFCSPHIGHO2_01_FULL_63_20 TaxID=1802385 RepID=A0A1F7TL57_9BACT|nr:MAG: hypothetical protein A2856_02990 [Candidatus Uhrbacteria bacterium RIFCSPHIGHO2_01_FULL_63_20]